MTEHFKAPEKIQLSEEEIANLSDAQFKTLVIDGDEIGGSGVHFPSTPVKYLPDLRSRVNSQQFPSIYEDRRPKIEDIERSEGKKSA